MRRQDLDEDSNRQADAELCRKFLTGSHSGTCEFVRRWQTPMYRIAFRIVGQSADAEEVRQAVLLRIIQRPEILPDPNRIRSWIHRCVINESTTLLRRRKRQTHLNCVDEFEAAEPSEYAEDAKQLQQLLATLPAETRALLALRFDEDLTVREIAEVVNKPRSTVHVKIKAAINALRQKLNPSQSGDQA